MCLLALAFQRHEEHPLVLASNRDEYFSRPTALPAWWAEHPDVFAGRDLQAGGSWLGVNRAGQFAAITNFREPRGVGEGWMSRGKLVQDFLCSQTLPNDYLRQMAEECHLYRGFNLLLGSEDELFYFNNRDCEILKLSPGVYGLSNGRLDSPWPKVQRLKRRVSAVIGERYLDSAALFSALSCAEPAEDGALPDTGVSREKERAYSPCFVTMENYGTRCSAVTRLSHREIRIEHREYGPNRSFLGQVCLSIEVGR